MKAFFQRSVQSFSICMYSIVTLTICHAYIPTFCIPSYAQTWSVSEESSQTDHEHIKTAPSSIWSEFLFGKRGGNSKLKFAFKSTDSFSNDFNVTQNNNHSTTKLRKFFGLSSSPDLSLNETINFPPHAVSAFQGSVNKDLQRLSDTQSIQFSPEDLPNQFEYLSRETTNKVKSVGQETRQHFDHVQNELGYATRAVQNRRLRLSQDVENQFLETQQYVEGRLVDIEGDTREIASKTEKIIRRKATNATNNFAKVAKDFIHDSDNDPTSDQSTEVGTTLSRNRQEISEKRRRRLDELNAILAVRNPGTFTHNEKSKYVGAEKRDEKPVDKINNSKIRQVSNLEVIAKEKRQSLESKKPQLFSTSSNNSLQQKEFQSDQSSRLHHSAENNLQVLPKTSSLRSPSNLTPSNVVKANQRQSPSDSIRRSNQESARGVLLPKNNLDSSRKHLTPKNKHESTFVAPQSAPYKVSDGVLSHKSNEQSTEKATSHDVIKNGVIRSSAKFIDPKDI